VGVAGVSGNGQRELADVVLGVRHPVSGAKLLWGDDASRWSIVKIREKGVASIPDDALAFACVPGLSVRENLALGTGGRYHVGVGTDWERLEGDMQRAYARLAFARPRLDAPIVTLSGGNLQRAVLVRELEHDPKLIVALYPTRGLDVRSIVAVHNALRDARDRGAAVLMVSEDLDELFALSDRLLVLCGGTIVAEFAPDSFIAETVGPYMVGAHEHVDAA